MLVICMYVCAYVHACSCMRVIYVYVWVCMQAYYFRCTSRYVYVCLRMNVCVHVYIHLDGRVDA